MSTNPQAHPLNPIAAVTHPDPYPYYADLVARTPLYYDAELRLWIASSADAVTAVLTNDLCRVRPPAEPVPKALVGSAAADIFGRLVRMNDGERHQPLKQAVSATLASLDTTQIAEQSVRWAGALSREISHESDAGRLTEFAFQLPVYVVASLLGVPQDNLPEAALWLSAFVKCLTPASTPEQIALGAEAAGNLIELFRALLEGRLNGVTDGLLNALACEAKRLGRSDEDGIIANGIGFLSQAYEATAGLIGNTLVTLASHQDVLEQVLADPGMLHRVVREVIRYDSPVQNTRRFLARSGVVAGQEMQEGDAILVVLAAANRDPLANAAPARFDPFRKDRRAFTFGLGPHACPGEMLSTTIAEAGVAQLIASGIEIEALADSVTYRVSANVRIPIWTKERDADINRLQHKESLQ